MLALSHALEGRDHRGYEIENAQFETPVGQSLGEIFVFPERKHIVSPFACLTWKDLQVLTGEGFIWF
jgi:hypothetical protein